MTRFLKSLGLAAGLACGISAAAFAQQATPVQQSGSRLDAATTVFAPTATINMTQATITIPALAGSCAYVDSAIVSLGMDATGTTGVQTFTTTNLGGLGWSFFPVVVATSPTTPYFSAQLVGATPLKSASCGLATTVVSPAQGLHNAYTMMVQSHYAP